MRRKNEQTKSNPGRVDTGKANARENRYVNVYKELVRESRFSPERSSANHARLMRVQTASELSA